jgi:hypothetical protein
MRRSHVGDRPVGTYLEQFSAAEIGRLRDAMAEEYAIYDRLLKFTASI